VFASTASAKRLHVEVLESAALAVNTGRAHGVLSLAQPPKFAMRSEQLDRNSCGPCEAIHGSIVQVDTPEFYDTMPPAHCLGGGRCRGVYVFSDGPSDLRQEDLADRSVVRRPPVGVEQARRFIVQRPTGIDVNVNHRHLGASYRPFIR
jgi:hypothetical protein